MKPKQPTKPVELTRTWALPHAATIGSSIRKKGIFLEVRARLPESARKALRLTAGALVVEMSLDDKDAFLAASATVSAALKGIEVLPVLPREIEDILAISTTERHRWLKDGRLPSAGTRTVKLRGRAKKVTFHVFEPRMVEDVLDRDLVSEWREQDAITAAENRRRAAWKANFLTRSQKSGKAGASPDGEVERPELRGWDEFERQGLLR